MVNLKLKGTLKKFAGCWKPSVSGDGDERKKGKEKEDLSKPKEEVMWCQNIGRHNHGEFSIAMVDGNAVVEDQCELHSWSLGEGENGPAATFVGIYDGHAGPVTSRFINGTLFNIIKRYTSESEEMSADIIRNAYLATEEEFLAFVRQQWLRVPEIASVGSCCLAGIICNGVLYIANAGDSRAVLGKLQDGSIKAVPLSEEHNANVESVREELQALHPDDPKIVVLKNKVWRVRGIIQISRSIGDAYLKKQEFNKPPLILKYQSAPFSEPILRAEPAIQVQELTAEDQFVIFASDGLWEQLSDQEAVDMVRVLPHDGIARELVRAALAVAARKREISYSELVDVSRETRRYYHDDITVIVLFLNRHSTTGTSSGGPVTVSVKSPVTL